METGAGPAQGQGPEKSEGRNPKPERSPQSEIRKTPRRREAFGLRVSDFFRISGFGFWISGPRVSLNLKVTWSSYLVLSNAITPSSKGRNKIEMKKVAAHAERSRPGRKSSMAHRARFDAADARSPLDNLVARVVIASCHPAHLHGLEENPDADCEQHGRQRGPRSKSARCGPKLRRVPMCDPPRNVECHQQTAIKEQHLQR